MGVPGNPPPPGLADTELFAVDAYRTEFEATVTEVERAPDGQSGRVALARTAFYPTGGGQPHDIGTLQTADGTYFVTGVRRERGIIWHTIDGEPPAVGAEVQGTIDWGRRHQLMRTHTALHVLCGVIWADYAIPVTGGNMEPLKGRLDFPFPAAAWGSADLGAQVERRINEEIAKAHEIVVDFLPRTDADVDPALIRTSANLIPREIDPLRVIDIVGLDRQADGGTHLLSTAEVGRVRVVGTESKGKDNKRIRIEVLEGAPE